MDARVEVSQGIKEFWSGIGADDDLPDKATTSVLMEGWGRWGNAKFRGFDELAVGGANLFDSGGFGFLGEFKLSYEGERREMGGFALW